MSQDFSLWKCQIRTALNRLCALDFHQAVGAQDSDASFRSAMHELYIESHFTEFLACDAWRQAGVSEATGQALQVLQHQLDAYDEPATDAAIVTDPNWWAIVGQAALVVTLLA
jgi:trimethylamine:corrinoid methyltransferase-like protein